LTLATLTFPASDFNSRPTAGRHPSAPGEKPVIGQKNRVNRVTEQRADPTGIQHLRHPFRKLKKSPIMNILMKTENEKHEIPR